MRLSPASRRALWALCLLATAWAAYALIRRFSGGGYGEIFAQLARISAPRWALLAALTAMFYALDYVRFYALLRILGHRIPLRFGLELTCASYFVSSLTPVSELHTPTMAFLMMKRGIPAPAALAVSMTKSVYMTLWICAFAYGSLLADTSLSLPPPIGRHTGVPMLPILFTAAALGAVAFFPERVHRWAERVLAAPATPRWKATVASALDQITRSIARIGRSAEPMHLLCHAASVTFLLVYCAIGWVIAGALGIELSPARAITVFSNSLMVAYLSPIPGSAGVTELSTSYLLDPAMTSAGMAVSVLLRVLCWYLVLTPGGLLLARAVRGQGWKAAFAMPGGT